MPYTFERVSESQLARWESPEPSELLALPPRNEYIPRDFSLRGEAAAAAAAAQAQAAEQAQAAGPSGSGGGSGGGGEGAEAVPPPWLLLATPRVRLWHKLDTRFLQPRGSAYFALTSPHARTTVKAAVLTQLAAELLVR